MTHKDLLQMFDEWKQAYQDSSPRAGWALVSLIMLLVSIGLAIVERLDQSNDTGEKRKHS